MNKRINESKSVGNLIVHACELAGMSVRTVVFSVYEPSSYFGPHGTLFTIDGRTCGQITTRRISSEIEALRGGSPERIAACDAFRAANEAEAYAAILAAYPEAAGGRKDRGEITMEVGS